MFSPQSAVLTARILTGDETDGRPRPPRRTVAPGDRPSTLSDGGTERRRRRAWRPAAPIGTV